jgi:hypothetical protein
MLDRIYAVAYTEVDMWEVEYTDQFGEWWISLDEDAQEDIDTIVLVLEDKGSTLARPYADNVRKSRHANMRELRVQSKGRPLRIFYAFDPRRLAILLIGGDKTGLSDERFYSQFVPIADRLYDVHLEEIQKEEHKNV